LKVQGFVQRKGLIITKLGEFRDGKVQGCKRSSKAPASVADFEQNQGLRCYMVSNMTP